MSASRAPGALGFHRIDRARADAVLSLDLGGHEALDFLDPVETILRAVRGGLAHLLFGMEDASGLVGFFVVHPDRRDSSCWWLGWFAVAQSHQGRGYGRVALEHVIQRLRRVDGCRRIRLYVAAANGAARRLYGSAGFSECATDDAGWHTLEYKLPRQVPIASAVRGFAVHAAPAKRDRRRMRLRSSVGPVAARSIGTVRGPPIAGEIFHDTRRRTLPINSHFRRLLRVVGAGRPGRHQSRSQRRATAYPKVAFVPVQNGDVSSGTPPFGRAGAWPVSHVAIAPGGYCGGQPKSRRAGLAQAPCQIRGDDRVLHEAEPFLQFCLPAETAR